MTTGRINQVAIVSSTRTATRPAGTPTGGDGGQPPATTTDRAGRPSGAESVCSCTHIRKPRSFTRETRPSADGTRRRVALCIRHTRVLLEFPSQQLVTTGRGKRSLRLSASRSRSLRTGSTRPFALFHQKQAESAARTHYMHRSSTFYDTKSPPYI